MGEGKRDGCGDRAGANLIEERGIDFDPTDDYLQEIRLAGGEDELISAIKSAKVTKPATVDPAAEGRQTEAPQGITRRGRGDKNPS